MCTEDQINDNSKSQDRDAPVQICKADAVIRGAKESARELCSPAKDTEAFRTESALGHLGALLDLITRSSRDSREWAKKEIKRLEQIGRNAIEAERSPQPCKHPALIGHGRDEDGAELLRCLECGAVGSRKELTA